MTGLHAVFGALRPEDWLAGRLPRGRWIWGGRLAGGLLVGGALLAVLPAEAQSKAEPVVQVRLHSGEVLAEWPMPEGAELQLGWAHSVTGGRVADCFAHVEDNLVLTHSYLHDFAAGLGEVTGRGQLVSAKDGGYWIEGIDAVLPNNRLSLRIGAPKVGHVLRLGAEMCGRLDWDMGPGNRMEHLPLSEVAAGAGVWISLMAGGDGATDFADPDRDTVASMPPSGDSTIPDQP